jgi:HSP20 family protein
MNKELVRKDPLDFFTPFFDFTRRLDEYAGRKNEGGMIVPAVDISETEDALVLHAELPGLKKDQVKITIEDGVLTIAGEKNFETEEKKKDYHRVERRFGSFHRSFTLPNNVDHGKAKAEFADGVLTVTLPKSEAAKPRQVEIN